MKKPIVILTAFVMMVMAFAFNSKSENTEEIEAVREVVMKSYINGAFNELDSESMSKGFHKDFAIFSAKGEEINKYPIAKWVEGVEKRKSDNYDPKIEKTCGSIILRSLM